MGLSFKEVNNDGMSAEQINKRVEKEKHSLENFNVLKSKLGNMVDLHNFLMTSHAAYSFLTEKEKNDQKKRELKLQQEVLDSY